MTRSDCGLLCGPAHLACETGVRASWGTRDCLAPTSTGWATNWGSVLQKLLQSPYLWAVFRLANGRWSEGRLSCPWRAAQTCRQLSAPSRRYVLELTGVADRPEVL